MKKVIIPNEKREELISHVGKRPLFTMALFNSAFVFITVMSPFVGIWFGLGAFIKLFLTGLFGAVLMHYVRKFSRKKIGQFVDAEINKQRFPKPKSKFHT